MIHSGRAIALLPEQRLARPTVESSVRAKAAVGALFVEWTISVVA